MKIKKTLVLPVIAVLSFFLAAGNVYATPQKSNDDKAASVNGTDITKKRLSVEVNRFKQYAAAQNQPVPDDKVGQLEKDILDDLINMELLYQDSKKKKIKVDDKVVADKMAELRGRFETEDQYKEAIANMNMSEKEIKLEITKTQAIQELVDQEISRKISISDEETKAFYDSNPNFFKKPEQIKVSHILIKVDANADEKQKKEAKKKIEGISKKLKKGGDFAALAKENSECPSSANGGDLGFFGRNQMVKPFEEAAFALKKDEVSGVVETPFGYHLIKLTDRKPEETIKYEDVKDKIVQVLKNETGKQKFKQYVENLRGTAKIESFL